MSLLIYITDNVKINIQMCFRQYKSLFQWCFNYRKKYNKILNSKLIQQEESGPPINGYRCSSINTMAFVDNLFLS